MSGSPKTKSGRRSLKVPVAVIDAILELKAEQDKTKADIGDKITYNHLTNA